MLTLPGISVPSPLRVFSQEAARRNASRAMSVVDQQRVEREEVERALARLDAARRSKAG